MEVTRTSLRAQRNQVPKQVRQGSQNTTKRWIWGRIKRARTPNSWRCSFREAPVIQAKKS